MQALHESILSDFTKGQLLGGKEGKKNQKLPFILLNASIVLKHVSFTCVPVLSMPEVHEVVALVPFRGAGKFEVSLFLDQQLRL